MKRSKEAKLAQNLGEAHRQMVGTLVDLEKKVRVVKQIKVNGNSIRVVVKVVGGEFQAQIKTRYQTRFHDYGPTAETEDHAFWWAFDAIKQYFQDGRTFALEAS